MSNIITSNVSLVKAVNTFPIDMQLAYFIGRNQKELLPDNTTRNIFVPRLGCYMSEPLAYENGKIKGTLIFNTTCGPISSGGTCLNCMQCKDDCYGIDSQERYINTLAKCAINTWLVLHDIEFLERQIIEQLERYPDVKYVRIHAFGDYPSQAEVDMWTRIAKIFNEKRFYFYTKVEHLFNFKALISLDNVNRVKSILPDGDINYGDPKYIFEKMEKFPDIPVCHYHDPRYMHFDPEKGKNVFDEIHCGVNHCIKCLFSEYMLFFKH